VVFEEQSEIAPQFGVLLPQGDDLGDLLVFGWLVAAVMALQSSLTTAILAFQDAPFLAQSRAAPLLAFGAVIGRLPMGERPIGSPPV
jgi:hypothetical protein